MAVKHLKFDDWIVITKYLAARRNFVSSFLQYYCVVSCLVGIKKSEDNSEL